MNKQVQTYDDLLLRQQQLKELLEAQKQLLRFEIEEIKYELRPLTKIVKGATALFAPGRDHSLLVTGAGYLIGMAIKKLVLPRAGWISRSIISFLAKNVGSRLVAGNRERLLSRLLSALTRKTVK